MRWLATPLLLPVLVACQGGLFGGQEFQVPQMRVEGNQVVEDSDLVAAAERYLKAFVKNGRRPADADDAAFTMETYLREEGFPEARVRFDQNGDALVFHVEEGPRARFGRVRFEGVSQIPVADLEKLFEFEGSGFLALKTPYLRRDEVWSAVSAVPRTARALRTAAATPL